MHASKWVLFTFIKSYIFLRKIIAAFHENMFIKPGLKSETWNFAQHFSAYLLSTFFLHNLCVLNSKLLDNFLYLVTFTFELEKHKMATESVIYIYKVIHFFKKKYCSLSWKYVY